jgi:hypothetical protein
VNRGANWDHVLVITQLSNPDFIFIYKGHYINLIRLTAISQKINSCYAQVFDENRLIDPS